jgi:hypothetical protein
MRFAFKKFNPLKGCKKTGTELAKFLQSKCPIYRRSAAMNLADFKPSNSATPTPIEPASWMRSALLSLALSEKGPAKNNHSLLRKQFVFSNCVLQAFEAILSANKITKEEARLVDELIQTYLCDDLLSALGEDCISVIHRLLMPFSDAAETPKAKSKPSARMAVFSKFSITDAPANFV